MAPSGRGRDNGTVGLIVTEHNVNILRIIRKQVTYIGMRQ